MNEELKKLLQNVTENIEHTMFYNTASQCGVSMLTLIAEELDPESKDYTILMPTDIKALWGSEMLINENIEKVTEYLAEVNSNIRDLRDYLEGKNGKE